MKDASGLVGQDHIREQGLEMQQQQQQFELHPVALSEYDGRDGQFTSLQAILAERLAPLQAALERIERTIESSVYFSQPNEEEVPLQDDAAEPTFELYCGDADILAKDYESSMVAGQGDFDFREKEGELRHSLARGMSLADLAASPDNKTWVKKLRRRITSALHHLPEEPQRTGYLNSLVTSKFFEHFSSLSICLNAAVVAYTSDWEMRNTDIDPPGFMLIVEIFMLVLYITEVILRLCNHRRYFFLNNDKAWNCFDLVIIALSSVDLFFVFFKALPDDEHEGGGKNYSYMRLFRLLKLVKVLRTFRVMRVFRDLGNIIDSFLKSVVALFWSLVMLAFILYVFALIFLQGLTGYLQMDWSGDPLEEENIRLLFGDLSSSMLSLYMSMTGGMDWRIPYKVVNYAGVFYSTLFLLFTFLILFAVFNILTGVFVEKAVVAAQPTREEFIQEQHRKTEETMKEFRHMCHLLDQNQTGTISREEVSKAMEHELMTSYMAAIGLEVRDKTEFFDMVGIDEEEVDINRFVDSCMALRGMATTMDMRHLSTTVGCWQKQNASTENAVMDAISKMQSQLERLQRRMNCPNDSSFDGSRRVRRMQSWGSDYRSPRNMPRQTSEPSDESMTIEGRIKLHNGISGLDAASVTEPIADRQSKATLEGDSKLQVQPISNGGTSGLDAAAVTKPIADSMSMKATL